MFDYQFTKTSLKRFKKLSKDIQIRIIGKLDFFCAQDDPVDFDVENEILVILDVDNRKDIYR